MQQLLRDFNAKSASDGSLKSVDNIAQMAAMLRPEMKDTFCGIYYPELLISIYKISLQKCSSSMGTDGSEVFGCTLVTEVDGEPSAIPYSLATSIS